MYITVSLSAMAKNLRKPRKFDAVLGGQVSSPVSDTVLGGIEGLYQRFSSVNEKVRLDAVVKRLAFVYKRIINRKCYFRVTDNIYL